MRLVPDEVAELEQGVRYTLTLMDLSKNNPDMICDNKGHYEKHKDKGEEAFLVEVTF